MRLIVLSGLNHVALRLNNIYGPGEEKKGHMKSIPSRFLQDAQENQLITVWSTEMDGQRRIPARDFLHVRDLVAIVDALIHVPEWKFRLMDVGTGKPNSFMQVAEIIQELAKCRIEVIQVPPHISLDHYQLFTRADTSNLLSLVPGFEFTTLKDGLVKMIDSVS